MYNGGPGGKCAVAGPPAGPSPPLSIHSPAPFKRSRVRPILDLLLHLGNFPTPFSDSKTKMMLRCTVEMAPDFFALVERDASAN